MAVVVRICAVKIRFQRRCQHLRPLCPHLLRAEIAQHRRAHDVFSQLVVYTEEVPLVQRTAHIFEPGVNLERAFLHKASAGEEHAAAACQKRLQRLHALFVRHGAVREDHRVKRLKTVFHIQCRNRAALQEHVGGAVVAPRVPGEIQPQPCGRFPVEAVGLNLLGIFIGISDVPVRLRFHAPARVQVIADGAARAVGHHGRRLVAERLGKLEPPISPQSRWNLPVMPR